MNFNDTTNRNGLIQDCESLLGFNSTDISDTSSSTNRLNDFTRLINARYRQAVTWIWETQDDWDFDDRNATTLPIATTTLVDSRQDYSLPTTAFRVERVEALNSSGDYELLDPIDKAQIKGVAMSEYYEDAGMPIQYDLVGRSLMLYPKPGASYVTTSSGLKVYVSRDITEFNNTSTTWGPGFIEPYHRIISLGASLDYAIGQGMTQTIGQLQTQLLDMKTGMQTFYASRHDEDFKKKIWPGDNKSFI